MNWGDKGSKNERPLWGIGSRAEVKQVKIYAAYGSNMNMEQMARRCPRAIVLDQAFLHNYQLCFRGNMSSGVATVIPQKGRRVPILLWGITEECEKSLDRYEGFPTLYRKENLAFSVLKWNSDHLPLPVDGTVEAMIYLMNVISASPLPLGISVTSLQVTGMRGFTGDTWM